MVLVDHYSNVGWVLFLKDKTGAIVTLVFRASFATVQPVITFHGPVDGLRTENGLELVKDDLKDISAELHTK